MIETIQTEQISSIFEMIIQSMEIIGHEMIRMKEIESDIMIKPIINQYSPTALKNVDKIIKHGVEATKKILETQLALEQWKEK